MTWVDLVVLAVLAVSALLAFMRGLVREVLGVGAWIGAAAVAFWGFATARSLVQRLLSGATDWVVDWVTISVLFIVSLIAFLLVAHWVGKLTRRSVLGGVDRTLGLLFGLARGAAIIVFAYIAGGWIERPAQWPQPVRDARYSLDAAYWGASWVRQRLPERLRPKLYEPPPGRATTADALLQATPQGRAGGR